MVQPYFGRSGTNSAKKSMKEEKQRYIHLILVVILASLSVMAGCSRFRSKAEFKPDIQPLPAQLKSY